MTTDKLYLLQWDGYVEVQFCFVNIWWMICWGKKLKWHRKMCKHILIWNMKSSPPKPVWKEWGEKKKKERERDFPWTNTHMLHGMQPHLPPLSLALSLSQHKRVTHSSAPRAGEEWVGPRSPRGPRPPPLPGESVYSGSSGQDGSCSASHRLTHKHTRVIQKCYSGGG